MPSPHPVAAPASPEQRAIAVQVLDQPEGVIVTGDRRQLESALGNLVENAVKYSEPGNSVQVRIRVEGRWAELMVADHGIGIPASDHDRIFERFERAVSARYYGGLGLGLYIARSIVGVFGGSIRAESTQGDGATFTMELRQGEAAPSVGSNERAGEASPEV